MAAPEQDKSLIASSEFDPNGFIKGIDAMTAALQKLSAQEDVLNKDLTETNAVLTANRKELKATEEQIKALDKSSVTYANDLKTLQDRQVALQASNKAMREQLTQQKQSLSEVNNAATQYKNAVQGLSAISKKVADENKGRSLFDIASLNAQITEITQLGSKLKNVFKGKIDDRALDELEEKLAGTKDEMQQLAEVIQFTKSKLDTLDPNSQEFADLTKIIETGEMVLNEYNDTLDNTTKKGASLRSQLKLIRDELARMEEAGQEGTEKFEELQIQAGQLADQIGDTQQRIRVLASDTKNLDFGIGAIRGLASAFGVAEGAAALFGLKNEDVQESIQRLSAIMSVLNGLQEIQNLLQKQSVVYIVGQNIATKALVVTQRILAATFGQTAAASRALNLALLGTGIGVFLVAIGLVIAALKRWTSASKEAADAQNLLNVALETNIEIADLMAAGLNDAAKIQELNVKMRQEQNKKIGQTDREAMVQQQKNNEEIRVEQTKALEQQLEAYRKRERAERANYDRAANRRRQFLNKEIEYDEAEFSELNKTIDLFTKLQEKGYALEQQLDEKRIQNRIDRQREINELREFDYQQLQAYLKRLEDLRDQVTASQNRVARQDAAQIRKQSGDNLRVQLREIDADVRKGVLNRNQAGILKTVLRQINAIDLAQELKDFNKMSADAIQTLERMITDIRMQAAEQRAALIKDDLEQEAENIRIAFQKEAEELTRARKDALDNVADLFDQGLISEEQARENAARIVEIYDDMLGDLTEKQAIAVEELSSRIFQRLQEEVSRTFREQGVIATEAITPEILKLTQRFLTGTITYEKYQKELTAINLRESQARIQQDLIENQVLLDGVIARQKIETDPERLKQLKDQEIALRQQIEALKRQLAGTEAAAEKADQDERDQRLQKLAAYANAIGGIASQVAQFWATANEAEQQALDRSIALQERRVEAATRIAERGNAEYLRLEEDRLNQLQVKQENAARRQLAINAVLQTSQALTAFVTALSQGIATGGPLGGIAVAAAVIGLIASGYAIITSLQRNNTQSFNRGTKSVRRNGEPSGVDTVPAMLTEGEAVIPVSNNREYSPAVAAIYDRTVPAEAMNDFVNSYRVNRRNLPRLNHDRISEASSMVVSYNGKIMEATEKQTRHLEENNHLMRGILRAFKTLGISVNVDKDGIAVSVMKAVEQLKIDKKV